MKYGLKFESVILNRYVTEKANAGLTITLKKICLVIDTYHGFLAASPDSGVEDNGSMVVIVECKTAVKFSKKTISECINEASFPLKALTINQTTHYELKESHTWYNQIQLQLFVFRTYIKSTTAKPPETVKQAKAYMHTTQKKKSPVELTHSRNGHGWGTHKVFCGSITF